MEYAVVKIWITTKGTACQPASWTAEPNSLCPGVVAEITICQPLMVIYFSVFFQMTHLITMCWKCFISMPTCMTFFLGDYPPVCTIDEYVKCLKPALGMYTH